MTTTPTPITDESAQEPTTTPEPMTLDEAQVVLDALVLTLQGYAADYAVQQEAEAA